MKVKRRNDNSRVERTRFFVYSVVSSHCLGMYLKQSVGKRALVYANPCGHCCDFFYKSSILCNHNRSISTLHEWEAFSYRESLAYLGKHSAVEASVGEENSGCPDVTSRYSDPIKQDS